MVCVIWYFQSKSAFCFEEKVKFIQLLGHFAQSPGLLATKDRVPNRLNKWKGILQSGKSRGNFEQTGKFRENHTKCWKFRTNFICNLLVIFKCTVYYFLKWIKFSVKKRQNI